MDRGYIKLWRKLLDSAVFADGDMWRLATWCLLKASRTKRPVKFDGGCTSSVVVIEPGQFVTGRNSGAADLGWNPSTFRNRMDRLEQPPFSFITMQKANLYTVVTVCNWAIYQADTETKRTSEGQAEDKRGTSEGQAEDTDNTVRMKDCKNELDTPPIPPAGGKAAKPRVPTFKNWTTEEFRQEVQANNGDGFFNEAEVDDFVGYWTEPNAAGKPLRSMQKTWDTRRRMNTAMDRIYQPRRARQQPGLFAQPNQRPRFVHDPNKEYFGLRDNPDE